MSDQFAAMSALRKRPTLRDADLTVVGEAGALPGSPEAGHVAALKQLWQLAYREASTLAYADAFRAFMVAFVIATLLVPLMRNVAPSGAGSSQAH
jgi:DHA2 family multidrug resistance protein